MINHLVLVGRLGQDPEQRSVGETSVVNFSVATSESWKDKKGNWQEKTEWHRVQAWGKLGENALDKFRKGDLVYIEGQVTYYKNKNDVDVCSIRANKARVVAANEKKDAGDSRRDSRSDDRGRDDRGGRDDRRRDDRDDRGRDDRRRDDRDDRRRDDRGVDDEIGF